MARTLTRIVLIAGALSSIFLLLAGSLCQWPSAGAKVLSWFSKNDGQTSAKEARDQRISVVEETCHPAHLAPLGAPLGIIGAATLLPIVYVIIAIIKRPGKVRSSSATAGELSGLINTRGMNYYGATKKAKKQTRCLHAVLVLFIYTAATF